MWMIEKILYVFDLNSRKGENGKLLIIGGSKQYHGAPVLAIMAARRFVDLIYFYPGENDRHLIDAVKRIPEVIVVYDLNEPKDIDAVLYGVGLGNAKPPLPKGEAEEWNLVIDGDGLKHMKDNIPEGAILTPHEGEFRILFEMEGTQKNVKHMARLHNCVILKKGPVDIISDGRRVVTNTVHNPGMTKGGTGDVLSGLLAALACKNDGFKAAQAAAWIAGNAGNKLRRRYGYNFCASDVAEELAKLR